MNCASENAAYDLWSPMNVAQAQGLDSYNQRNHHIQYYLGTIHRAEP